MQFWDYMVLLTIVATICMAALWFLEWLGDGYD